MSLKKTPVKINFTQGVDTKTDPMLTTKLLQADNVLFDGANTLKTRKPFIEMASEDGPQYDRLSEYRGAVCTEDTVNAGGAGYFSVRDAQTGAPTSMSPSLGGPDYGASIGATEDYNFIRYMQDVQTVGALGAGQPAYVTSASSVTAKTSVYAWINTVAFSATGAIAGVLLDDQTGAVEETFRLDPPAATTYTTPKLLRVDGSTNLFFLYYRKTVGGVTSLCVRTSATALFHLATEHVITTIVGLFDASFHTAAGKIYVACETAAFNTTHLRLNLDGFTVASTSTTAITAGSTALNIKALSTYDGTTVRHFAFFTVYDTKLWMVSVTAAGVAGADGVLFNYAATWAAGSVISVTACDPKNTMDVAGAVEVRTKNYLVASPNDTVVFTWNMPKSTGVAAKRGTIIGAPIFGDILYDSSAARVLLSLRRYDLVSPSIYVVDVTRGTSPDTTYDNTPPVVVSRPEYGNCGGSFWAFGLPPLHVSVLYDGRLSFPFTRWTGKSDTDGSTNVSPWYVARAVLSPPALSRGQLGSIETQGCLMLAGGCPQWFDGRDMVEAGFNFRPWVSLADGGAGSLSAGVYSIACTYQWEDSQGNWHESAPSNIQTITLAASHCITVTVGLLGLTRMRRARIRLYRSGVAGGPLGEKLLYEQDVLNDLSVATTATATMTVTAADSTITGSTALPTSGGIKPNDPPPACRHIEEFGGRLWYSGCSDGHDLVFSQVLDRGIAPEHSIDFGRRSPQGFGRVVATAEMESRLAVFCENQLGVIYGTGPTPSGDQDNFSEIILATHEGARWQSPNSVVHTREGIWYHANGGLRLVQNDGQLATTQEGRELGSEIDSLVPADGTIVAGVRKDVHEVWFADLTGGYTEAGASFDVWSPVHVWNWTWRQWSRLGVPSPLVGNLTDMAVTKDLGPVFASTQATGPLGSEYLVRYDSAYAGAHAGNDFDHDADWEILQRITTGEMSFAGIQGFQRVYRLQVVGTTVANGVINGTLTPYFDGAAGTATDFSATADANGRLQFEHLFEVQKCQSLKLSISMYSNNAPTRLTSLNLLVGVKGGVAKLPTSQRF